MIDLNLKRNEQGYYILDEEALKQFKVSRVINQYSNEPEDDLKIESDETEIFVKVSKDNGYMMSIYGELLFSAFAEMNGIPCAEIDVALYDGKPVLLSKSVKQKNGKLLTYTELEKLIGKQLPKNTMLEISTAVNENIGEIRKNLGEMIQVHPNFENNLKVVSTVDYSTAQADRHQGNIGFEIVDGVLNVAPLYDNEAVFNFMEVRSFYQDYPEYFDSIFIGQDKDVEAFKKFYDREIKESAAEVRPQFGMITTANYDKRERVQESMDWYGDGRYASLVNKTVCGDIAIEMMRSKKFSEFCSNLEFNAQELAEIIKMETGGFEIPPQFLDLAQNIYNQKRQELKKMKKLLSGKEMGE